MKKLTQKWKELNKNGLKLSLICGLNWLIKNIIIWQFLIAEYFFIGLIFQYAFRTADQDVAITLIVVFMLIVPVRKLLENFQTGFISLMKSLILILILLKVYHMSLSVKILEISFYMFLISGSIYLFGKRFQPKIFNAYLFKHVLNKEYLGIRKLTDDFPPETNLYTDVDEADADKRMKMINQHVIKKPYQGVVELSFLNREMITGIGYQAVPFEKEKERAFMDVDTIYYPVFRVYPFGITGDFGHILIKFKLSRRTAFLKEEKGFLKE